MGVIKSSKVRKIMRSKICPSRAQFIQSEGQQLICRLGILFLNFAQMSQVNWKMGNVQWGGGNVQWGGGNVHTCYMVLTSFRIH